jgi:prepilin-type N-terminal cleavage/methylation domain-containing protein
MTPMRTWAPDQGAWARRSPARRGFTLMEVLLALGLIGVLLGSVLGFLFQIGSQRDALAAAGARQQGATALLERMESDLLCVVASGVKGEAGVQGGSSQLTLLTRGTMLPGEPGKAAAMGDLQGTEYAFDPGAQAVRVRRWSAAGDGAGGGDLETMCEGVGLMRLRYYDGERWSASFDSGAAGGLPVAVEVAVWFGRPGPGGEEAGAGSEGGAWKDRERTGAGKREDGGGAALAGPERRSAGRKAGATDRVAREPDRVRLIVAPDGPVSSWKELR